MNDNTFVVTEERGDQDVSNAPLPQATGVISKHDGDDGDLLEDLALGEVLEHRVDLEKLVQRPLDLASAEPTTIDERGDELVRNLVERFHIKTPLLLGLPVGSLAP